MSCQHINGQVKTKQSKIGREEDSPSQTSILVGQANHQQEEEVQAGRQEDQEVLLSKNPRPVLLVNPPALRVRSLQKVA